MALVEENITQVDIMRTEGEEFRVAETFHVNSKELLHCTEAALAHIKECADRVCACAGHVVTRITYQDDDGDWCTLSQDTMCDALDFTRQLPTGVHLLSLRVVSAPPEPQQPAAAPEQEALQQLNMLAHGVDLRRLLPKLAAVVLQIVNDIQLPELFPLIEPACLFQEGKLKAESLPLILPQLVDLVTQLPADRVASLVCRFRQEASKAVVELKQEQDAEGSKELEVHPTVVCDGCDAAPIVGPRYKSLKRVNYDLCQVCYKAADRDAQNWKRMRSSITGSVISSYFAPAAPPPHEGCTHPGVVCDLCDASPIVGKRFRCLDLEDYDLCEPCLARTRADPETASLRFEEVAVMTVAGASLATFEAAESVPEESKKESPLLVPIAGEQSSHEIAAVDTLQHMSHEMLREVVSSLLKHDNGIVQAEVAKELSRFRPVEMEQQLARSSEELEASDGSGKASTDGSLDLAELPTENMVQTEEDEATDTKAVELEADPAPSAQVLACTELVLGPEVSDHEGARGDVTAEFSQVLAQVGAKQAFRAGRLAVPVGGTRAVPVCARVLVVNSGAAPWPASTSLALVAGPAMNFPQIALGGLSPGEAAEVQMDMCLPPKSAQDASRSAWALLDAMNGQMLGPLIFVEVIWQ